MLLPLAWALPQAAPVHATEHLRTIRSAQALRPDGGLMATALCGAVLDGGHDVRQVAERDFADLPEQINDWRCPACLYIGRTSS